MNEPRQVILTAVCSVAAFGQSLPARPQFEVASIRPSAPLDAGQVKAGVHVDGARVSCTHLSLSEYVQLACRVKAYQVSGPDWLASERFDVVAALPTDSKSEEIPDMIQELLAERFRMKLHRDTKEFPVYALVPATGGPKLKGSPLDSDADGTITTGNNRFGARSATMATLADALARFVDRPVIGITGIKGMYDFTLEFSPEDFRAMLVRGAIAAGAVLPPDSMKLLDGASGDSPFSAVEKLGLKLEPRKAKLEMVVIDHMEKDATDN